MKAQRLQIVESGMETFSDVFGGYQFTNGLSDDPINQFDAIRLGSIIRLIAVDDDRAVGAGQTDVDHKNQRAEVVVSLAVAEPVTVAVEEVKVDTTPKTKYTREQLEALADERGIGGLREIAEGYGVKGRGIVELINEIIKAQG